MTKIQDKTLDGKVPNAVVCVKNIEFLFWHGWICNLYRIQRGKLHERGSSHGESAEIPSPRPGFKLKTLLKDWWLHYVARYQFSFSLFFFLRIVWIELSFATKEVFGVEYQIDVFLERAALAARQPFLEDIATSIPLPNLVISGQTRNNRQYFSFGLSVPFDRSACWGGLVRSGESNLRILSIEANGGNGRRASGEKNQNRGRPAFPTIIETAASWEGSPAVQERYHS